VTTTVSDDDHRDGVGPPSDLRRLRQAVAAADGARRTVSPRPWVGAVVVPADAPADHPGFAGSTQGRTGPHAEVVALAAAGDAARGGTIYVTLEPCTHAGARPRSCADAVIEAGIARAVVAVADPDTRVAGHGIAALRAAGVEVEVGVAADEVEAQLRPYLHHRRTGRPLVLLKLAASLDGRTAAPDGTSQWITGAPARADAHRLRADCDAIVVGAGTARADDPALTVRLDPGELPDGFVQPLRVVLGTAPDTARMQPAVELGGDLGHVLDDLGARGVLQVLVEGGAAVAHDLHQAGLVDRYVLYLAPLLLGGDDGRGLFAGPGAATLAEAWRGRVTACTRLGDDLRIDLEPRAGEDDPEGSMGSRRVAAGTVETGG
jgi:diaminohydroxyphosphoribosylaminopyrimidine deaminase / 5-amino-6-(5-phosphoribosylamino)uracil reductase